MTKGIGINKTVLIIGIILEIAIIAAIFITHDYTKPTYETYLHEGERLLKEGEYEESIESFDKAIELASNGVKAMVGRSDAYMALGDYDNAISSIEQAIKITPKHPVYYNKLIKACVEANYIETANEAVATIIEDKIPTGRITSVKPAPEISTQDMTTQNAIAVTFKSDEIENGDSIYYTDNKEYPTTADKKYEKPVLLTEKGEYQLTARVIEENGLMGFPASISLTVEKDENADSDLEKYKGSWSDGETTLSITGVNDKTLSFNIRLSWVDEVIKTSSSGTVKSGVLTFSYTDNWGNKGTGIMRLDNNSITFKINETKSAGVNTPGFGNYSTVLY